ncbi:MAG: hypothetical protein O3C40_32585, partial [Planctomycetota bacterium]|nr:hypothetical protein [Planctomycetota bacterium]
LTHESFVSNETSSLGDRSPTKNFLRNRNDIVLIRIDSTKLEMERGLRQETWRRRKIDMK